MLVTMAENLGSIQIAHDLSAMVSSVLLPTTTLAANQLAPAPILYRELGYNDGDIVGAVSIDIAFAITLKAEFQLTDTELDAAVQAGAGEVVDDSVDVNLVGRLVVAESLDQVGSYSGVIPSSFGRYPSIASLLRRVSTTGLRKPFRSFAALRGIFGWGVVSMFD